MVPLPVTQLFSASFLLFHFRGFLRQTLQIIEKHGNIEFFLWAGAWVSLKD